MAVARGELSTAGSRFCEVADEAVATDQLAAAIACLHDAVRIGDRSAAGRLRDLAGRVDGPLAGARADHAAALVAEDGHALDDVAARFEAMAALLLAAEAFAAASGHHRAER